MQINSKDKNESLILAQCIVSQNLNKYYSIT